MKTHSELDRLMAMYSGAPLAVRAYLRARSAAVPFREVSAALSAEARSILDLGCGHGQLANFLALCGRRAHGIDLLPRRIAVARDAARGRLNSTFSTGDITGPLPAGFDAIVAIDCLHYLPLADQDRFIKSCFAALPARGRLIVRTIDADGSPRFVFNALHERLSALAGLTARPPRGFHFASRQRTADALSKSGFSQITSFREKGFSLYTDTLFVASKPAEGQGTPPPPSLTAARASGPWAAGG